MADTDNNTNFDDFFGASALGGGNFEKTLYHKIKDGSNIYRIAPANRSLAQAGRWWVRGDLHYGYTLPNERDPSKPFHKPFLCIQKKNFDTGMITEECPECTLISTREEALKDTVGARIEANMARGMDKATAEADAEGSVKLMKRWFQEHNLDRKIYVLAKNEAGQWGVLGIRGKARDAVVETFKKYEQRTGKNPLDARSGLWVDISRSGTGLSTIYSAAIVQIEQNDGSFRNKDGGLTAADMGAIKALPDLANLHDRNRLNYDQIKALANGDNNQETVSKVFGATTRRRDNGVAGALAAAVQAPVAAAAPVPAPVAQPVAPVPAIDPNVAAMMEQLRTLQEQLAQATKGERAPVQTTVTGTTASAGASDKSVKNMNPEEFKKFLGNL